MSLSRQERKLLLQQLRVAAALQIELYDATILMANKVDLKFTGEV